MLIVFGVLDANKNSKYFCIFGLKQCRKQDKNNIKVFLMIESGPGFMGSLDYSLLKLWWTKSNSSMRHEGADNIICNIRINMGITS